jgi:hypothetical protein
MPTEENIIDLTSDLTDVLRADVLPPPPQYYTIQRRGARIRLRERLPVQLNFWDAHCIDISRSGALVEHTERIRPGEVYRLAFPGKRRQVQVLATAIRSHVSRIVHKTNGEGQIVYRTGMEFVGGENGHSDLVSGSIEWIPQLPGGS